MAAVAQVAEHQRAVVDSISGIPVWTRLLAGKETHEQVQHRYRAAAVHPRAGGGPDRIRSLGPAFLGEGKERKGTPRSQKAQAHQFEGAFREGERRIGRQLDKTERRRLHEEITGQNMVDATGGSGGSYRYSVRLEYADSPLVVRRRLRCHLCDGDW